MNAADSSVHHRANGGHPVCIAVEVGERIEIAEIQRRNVARSGLGPSGISRSVPRLTLLGQRQHQHRRPAQRHLVRRARR